MSTNNFPFLTIKNECDHICLLHVNSSFLSYLFGKHCKPKCIFCFYGNFCSCAPIASPCTTWQLNGTSIFAGPGLENLVGSVLSLNIANGFITLPVKSQWYYQYPLEGTKLLVDFEVICMGQCRLTLRNVSIPNFLNLIY